MGNAPAFQLFAADFLVDTASWTVEEMGIYCRLLYSEWCNGPLPNNHERLARIAGCNLKLFSSRWDRQIKGKFLTSQDGSSIYNSRLEETREKQAQYLELQSKKGKKSAEKRWGKPITTVTTTAITTVQPALQPEDQPNCNSSSSSSRTPIIPLTENQENGGNHKVPHQEILSLWKEIIPEAIQPKDWSTSRQALLKARWHSASKRQTLEYWQKLFTYVRESDFLMGKESSPGRNPFSITLPWLLKEENFLKVIEGKYHRKDES